MARPQASTNRPGKQVLWISLLLGLSVFISYIPAITCSFLTFDDPDYISNNPIVQAGITVKGILWAFQSEVARNWHPVTMLSHMLDCQLWGLNPIGHHVTNTVLHAFNTVLLFLLLRKLTGALWRSATVAALFGLHPLHVESVAWMAERKDLLSTLFLISMIWAYCDFVRNRRTKSYILALVFFALGLMSKPMLVTAPFVLLLLDFWPLGRFSRPFPTKKLVIEKIPFFAMTLAACWITFLVQQRGGAVRAASALPLDWRLANALLSYVLYLWKTLWPVNLAGLYLRHEPWPAWLVAISATVLITITVFVIRTARQRGYLIMGWFWYLGTLVPVIGLIQVGMQSMADRYTYIPLIGVFIGIVWLASDIAQARQASFKAALGIGGTVLAACALATWHQIGFWKDSETFYHRIIAMDDRNYVAHYNLANFYGNNGKFAESIAEYEAALRGEPNYAAAHNNLGVLLQKAGRLPEAIEHYAAAARLLDDFLYTLNLANALTEAQKPAEALPYFQRALQSNNGSPDAHHNFAIALERVGRNTEAAAQYEAALKLNPGYEIAHFKLAEIEANAGRLDNASAHYAAAIRLNPRRADYYNGLGICLAMQGKMPQAVEAFQTSIQCAPDSAEVQINLGNALSAIGKPEEAISHYTKGIELKPDDSKSHFIFADFLQHHGQTAEAINHFRAALRLDPNSAEARAKLAELGAQ